MLLFSCCCFYLSELLSNSLFLSLSSSFLSGANAIEMADGKVIKLEKLSAMERAGRAKLLLQTPGIKVYRHLVTGDALLVNRQPTLHKPGIMAHKARVLEHMKEQTLRMNYANCNTYNADFDGDEMNCHFLQSELARAEAYFIANTDNQYIIPTSGNPLRGLIQDHVASAVKLTCKDTFLTKENFQQLVFIALSGLSGTEIVLPEDDIALPLPTIWVPERLWTGKQVITTLLTHLCRPPLPPLSLDAKARTPATAYGSEHLEHEVIIRKGELLTGVLDKNAIGNSSLGLVHAVYELYGAELAGKILNSFGRLCTYFLQDSGHSCGIQDLILLTSADRERRKLLNKLNDDCKKGLEKFLIAETIKSDDNLSSSSSSSLSSTSATRLASFFAIDRKSSKIKIDNEMQSIINHSASDVIKACLPNGLNSSFRSNHFSIMVLTGAKGSSVNQSQISCLLGQQALEGARVPMMCSGKTLPSFSPFDGSARAGGFVQDRFLTGVKPQEYYFHCMAGREGLVDTAVKTSRSGYLQRCLVKSLEELKVSYDMTVRDSGSNIIQFLYGEDGLDPVNAALLGGNNSQLLFISRNSQALAYKYSLHSQFFEQGIEMDTAQHYHRQLESMKSLVKSAGIGNPYNYEVLQKGHIVLARKKVLKELGWGKDNISRSWYIVEIIKIRRKEHYSFPSCDLLYEDGTVEKKVPCALLLSPSSRSSVASSALVTRDSSKLPLYLIKIALPDDTPMSKLKLGNSVGACSEKIQDSLTSYIKSNPDKVIRSTNEEGNENNIAADALELLVWVKYMRSLANPGEAVGCVAAQSVGEPSTQMTLNTFHLAGHGGGNVTLGIPRLREIIMTGSKLLKTPTMFIPLQTNRSFEAAKSLARTLSSLSLTELLDHSGGIEVGEEIFQSSTIARWERKYRIRLRFQRKELIEKVFGISFDLLISTVRKAFIAKLDWFIKLDQRRAGEATSGKNDPLKQFRSKTSDEKDLKAQMRKAGGAGNKGEDGEGGGDDDEGTAAGAESDNEGGRSGGSKGKKGFDDEAGDDTEEGGKGGKKKGGYGSDEDDESEDDSDIEGRGNENDDLGNLKLSGSAKEMVGYDDEDDDEVGEDDYFGGREKGGNMDRMDLSEDEDDDDQTVGSERRKGGALSPATPSSSAKKKSDPKASAAKDKNIIPLVETNNFTFNEVENWIEMIISYPVYNRRLLMAQIAEKAAKETMIRSTKHIKTAYPIDEKNSPVAGTIGVSTEGVNFEAIWELPDTLINYNDLLCNDIWKILLTYGVEAARLSIVKEIQAVFNVYGINVNTRHLLLIADFMTRNGSYTPMNRIGMRACSSPFLQMSFESTVQFLTRATEEGMIDNHQSPSSSLVLGSVPKIGTGYFDVMLPLV
jgi:DNA-directed RNA polymerase I subunit RPA1